jgi:hypothetical protein
MQRTAPYAQLVTFDAPDPNLMCARRERSNSPLQALTLLNDPVFFEAAQALARRVLTEAPEPARLDYAFRLCFGRAPSASERDQAASFLARERDRLARETDTSHELFPAHLEGIEPRTAAAWTLLASGLLNTDEFVTRE